MGSRHRTRDYELLLRYLAGGCSAQEARGVRARLSTDAAFARLYDVLRTDPPPEPTTAAPDVDAAWRRFDGAVRARAAEKASPSRARIVPLRSNSAPRAAARPALARPAQHAGAFGHALRLFAAATLVGILTWGAVHLTASPPPSPEVAASTYATPTGVRSKIQLRDGTHVLLGPGTRLDVFDFAADRRRVRLDGEAFFEVARDEARPFVVETAAATLQVLGTAFGVTTLGERESVVAVREGVVALLPPTEAPSDSLLLRANDVGTARDTTLAVTRGADLDAYLAWTEGRLVFDEATFSDVQAALARWYNLDITLRDAEEAPLALTASFQDEPPAEILNVIASAMGLRYEREGRSVRFYPPPAASSAP